MGQESFLGYIDFMYSREGIDSKGLISEVTAVNGEGTTVPNVDYFTTIFNLDYRVASHWNMYVKGVYEQGNVFKSNDEFSSGTYRRVWNVQFCAEYYPLKNSELLCYLHLLYKNIHLTEKARSWGAESYNHQRICIRFGLYTARFLRRSYFLHGICLYIPIKNYIFATQLRFGLH